MNFYKHHIGDYDADTAHLSWLEDAAYRRLMCLYYRREQPIPADIGQACRLVRATAKAEREAVESVLNEFFTLCAGGWVNRRCEGEIDAAQAKANANRDNGKRGGRPRKAETEDKPIGLSVGSESHPTQNLLQTPDTRGIQRAEPAALAGKPPTDPPRPVMSTDEIIFGYGVPLLVNAGTADKQARSFLGKLRKAHGDDTVVNTLRQCLRAKPLQPLEWLAKALPPAAQAPPEEVERKRRQAENDKALAMLNGHNDAEVFDGTARVL